MQFSRWSDGKSGRLGVAQGTTFAQAENRDTPTAKMDEIGEFFPICELGPLAEGLRLLGLRGSRKTPERVGHFRGGAVLVTQSIAAV